MLRRGRTGDASAGEIHRPGGAQSRAAAKSRARAATRCPRRIKPQLATLVDKVPGDEGWVYELKYDGVRLLCRCDGDDVRCISRNGIDWTHKVGPIVEALAKLKLDGAWVDGELIVTDPNGRSDFSLLQHTLEQGRLDELQFCIFDLLYYSTARTCAACRCRERKTRLDAAFAKLPRQRPAAARRPDPQRQRRSCSRASATSTSKDSIAKKIDSPYTGDRSETGSR